MKIKVSKFLGYSSKQDAAIDNPAIGKDCNNVIIHKGNLCNFPYPIQLYDGSAWAVDGENLVGIYRNPQINKTLLFMVNSNGEIWYTTHTQNNLLVFTKIAINMINFNTEPFSPFRQNTPSDEVTKTNVKTLGGNFVQVGDWLYWLIDCYTNLSPLNLPTFYNRMIKFAIGRNVNLEYTDLLVEPIGMYAPSSIATADPEAGNISGTYKFGFSLIRTKRVDSDISALQVEDIESNVTLELNEYNYVAKTSKITTIEVLNDNAHYNYRIGIYAKNSNQSNYYLIGYSPIVSGSPITEDIVLSGVTYKKINFSTLSSIRLQFNLTNTVEELQQSYNYKLAPFTGVIPVVGAHNVPRPCYHGEFFKSRMYYSSTGRPTNLLQISARTPIDQIETGQYAQYIEAWELVGSENETITGLITYLGQLFIFKETKTYVLTDDIQVASLRTIFEDVGCVNVRGGHGYIVADDKLFFVAKTGIYMFDGNQKIKISDDIEEDLLKISALRYNYVRLSWHPVYELLLVSFPFGYGCGCDEEVPTFVFSIKGGGWTKIDHISSLVIDKDSAVDPTQKYNIYANRHKRLELLGLLDKDLTVGPNVAQWFWQSSIFDWGDAVREKHWQFLTIETIPRLNNNNRIKALWSNELNEEIGNHISIVEQEVKHRVIEAHSAGLMIRLEPGLFNYTKAFRIKGLILEGYIKGQR